jgi:hypothetical protein
MLAAVAFIVALLVAMFLVTLGVACFVTPVHAQRFLGSLASTARLHFVEVILRIVAGAALVVSAPRMLLGSAIAAFGWIVLATSVGMALVPWRLHQRFAAAVVPHVSKRLRVVGLVAAAGGLGLLAALVVPRVPG